MSAGSAQPALRHQAKKKLQATEKQLQGKLADAEGKVSDAQTKLRSKEGARAEAHERLRALALPDGKVALLDFGLMAQMRTDR